MLLSKSLLEKKGFRFLENKDRTYLLEIKNPDRIYGVYQAAGLADEPNWGIRDKLMIQCNEDFSYGVLYDGVDLYRLEPDDFEELILWL